ncbi:MBL fold metallo-hydrolase [Leptothoe spongobia]|uniref:MBL fold metallo-hydrolase n=1 Tax=Leptothoe spongobia TAU-MAC 1115 TaxID=1967444 RepID=A0A947DGT7_9CYAN|nr:MBL fold metallo-hydrolase [Leptothoe spongobia]MBT9316323.1 MBL fold metallo-hydrolase [Leptothoe spongobia TAU-MAC 1115]
MSVSAYRSGKESTLQYQPHISIKFWGVRGSVPTPGAATAFYGGNTCCIEVLADQQRFIFDGGTGLRVLGESLHQQSNPVKGHLFFTHTQWDRIQGFPFFLPAFEPGNQFHIYGGTAANGASIKQCLTTQMLKPGFAVPLQAMQAELMFHDIVPGSTIQIGDTTIEPIGLNGHTNALGYRLSHQGKSVVYATDTDPERIDENLIFMAHQAELLIYDGMYVDMCDQINLHPSPKPWQAAIQLAQSAHVKQLAMIHYGPRQTDTMLNALAHQLKDIEPHISLAHEGLVISF